MLEWAGLGVAMSHARPAAQGGGEGGRPGRRPRDQLRPRGRRRHPRRQPPRAGRTGRQAATPAATRRWSRRRAAKTRTRGRRGRVLAGAVAEILAADLREWTRIRTERTGFLSCLIRRFIRVHPRPTFISPGELLRPGGGRVRRGASLVFRRGSSPRTDASIFFAAIASRRAVARFSSRSRALSAQVTVFALESRNRLHQRRRRLRARRRRPAR